MSSSRNVNMNALNDALKRTGRREIIWLRESADLLQEAAERVTALNVKDRDWLTMRQTLPNGAYGGEAGP